MGSRGINGVFQSPIYGLRKIMDCFFSFNYIVISETKGSNTVSAAIIYQMEL